MYMAASQRLSGAVIVTEENRRFEPVLADTR
jgi:hypothetical protein